MDVAQKHLCDDGLRELRGPVSRHVPSCPEVLIGGHYRDGMYFKKKDIIKVTVLGKWAYSTEGGFMNIIEELKGNYDEAEKLWADYDVKLKAFRNAIKNDVSSLEASARKTTTAVQRMQKAYGDVIELMNSEMMAQATLNAERLAKAMQTLASLESHRLTIGVDNAD